MTDKIEVPRNLLESLLECADACVLDHPGEGYGGIAQRTFQILQDDLHARIHTDNGVVRIAKSVKVRTDNDGNHLEVRDDE